MALDKYSRLKIASNILDEPLKDMAASWDVTLQSVKGVCDGHITSERLEKNINAKISEAEALFDEHRDKEKLATTNQ